MISFERTEELLNKIAEGLPQEFFRELNGGILLLPEARRHPEDVDGSLLMLGEYAVSGSMGRYISIFYGSVIRVYGNLPEEQFENKLRNVLLHEFTHHLESMAGERGLEEEDRRFIDRYRDNTKERKRGSST